jgi:hypothetical protein
MVVADVVVRIIIVGCEDEKERVRRVPRVGRPDHRRKIQAQVRTVEDDLRVSASVVDAHPTVASGANQELMAQAVRVLAPDVLPRHVEDHEVTAYGERHLPPELASRQVTSGIFDKRQSVEAHIADADAPNGPFACRFRIGGHRQRARSPAMASFDITT